ADAPQRRPDRHRPRRRAADRRVAGDHRLQLLLLPVRPRGRSGLSARRDWARVDPPHARGGGAGDDASAALGTGSDGLLSAYRHAPPRERLRLRPRTLSRERAVEITLYQIDAFTDRVFAGNPAAVCPLETWLPDETMQAIA